MPTKAKKFTEQEVSNAVTINIMRSFGVTRTQATAQKASLENDFDGTSFGLLDLIINLWEDLGLNFNKIPATHVRTVADIHQLALNAVRDAGKLELSTKVDAATKQFDSLQTPKQPQRSK